MKNAVKIIIEKPFLWKELIDINVACFYDDEENELRVHPRLVIDMYEFIKNEAARKGFLNDIEKTDLSGIAARPVQLARRLEFLGASKVSLAAAEELRWLHEENEQLKHALAAYAK